MKTEQALFAGGCFWCLEAIFESLVGVEKVISGYSMGNTINPTYQEVSTGLTNHAEVVQITFNPEQITYSELLAIFFAIHNPTELNRQGHDIGIQYRSGIYYYTEQQQQLAQQLLEQIQIEYIEKIVTEIKPAQTFYPAETEHHHYFQTHSEQAYCQMVIGPKYKKARELFAHLWR